VEREIDAKVRGAALGPALDAAPRAGASEQGRALLARRRSLSPAGAPVKAARERVKQASRELLASIKARLAELNRFWEKEQAKADVEVFFLDEVFAELPTPPFTAEKLVT
jgi:hypothetical protein